MMPTVVAARVMTMVPAVVATRVVTMMAAEMNARMVTAPVTSKVPAAMATVAASMVVVSAYLASRANTTLKWHQREITRPRQVLRQNRRGLSGV
jgi:uncharacterized membrane protein (DUF485 family)